MRGMAAACSEREYCPTMNVCDSAAMRHSLVRPCLQKYSGAVVQTNPRNGGSA